MTACGRSRYCRPSRAGTRARQTRSCQTAHRKDSARRSHRRLFDSGHPAPPRPRVSWPGAAPWSVSSRPRMRCRPRPARRRKPGHCPWPCRASHRGCPAGQYRTPTGPAASADRPSAACPPACVWLERPRDRGSRSRPTFRSVRQPVFEAPHVGTPVLDRRRCVHRGTPRQSPTSTGSIPSAEWDQTCGCGSAHN